MDKILSGSFTHYVDHFSEKVLPLMCHLQISQRQNSLVISMNRRKFKRLEGLSTFKESFRKPFCSTEDRQTSFIQEFTTRSSADEVRKEILSCYELVQKLGKGVVYLGSSRTQPGQSHFLQAMELAKEVSLLLDCTSWTGVGPGLMDAVVKGALKANMPVGGFKISREAGEWTKSNIHPYLEEHVYYTCRFFSARKHGLVDAAVRNHPSDRTAFIALPGGIGTLDEIFEILTLIQLQRIGSTYPVPFLLMNYDGFYSSLMEFLSTCKLWGTIAEGEVEKLWKVCDSNKEALQYLADFYSIAKVDQHFRDRVR